MRADKDNVHATLSHLLPLTPPLGERWYCIVPHQSRRAPPWSAGLRVDRSFQPLEPLSGRSRRSMTSSPWVAIVGVPYLTPSQIINPNHRERLSSTRSPIPTSKTRPRQTSVSRRRITSSPSKSLVLGTLSRSRPASVVRSYTRARGSTAGSQSLSAITQVCVVKPP